MRNFQLAVGMDPALFDPHLLSDRYGDAVVDVVNQDPEATVMAL